MGLRARGSEVNRLNVTITKTSDGRSDYIQVMSHDMTTVNVVLIADEIKVEDFREGSADGEKK